MFHQIIILLLIVSSLFCNFNRYAVCFQSLTNIACMSSQNAACIKRFWRLHNVIKPLNKEINIIQKKNTDLEKHGYQNSDGFKMFSNSINITLLILI